MHFSPATKLFLIFTCLVLSVIGFLVKLPSVFHHHDKELHALFYFSAAAFLNVLFENKNIIWHAVIFATLYFFSVGIEYAQAYSNTFFHTKIHGRYDPEDVYANLQGLVAFSFLWFAIVAVLFFYNNIKSGKFPNASR